ncbi:MAG: phosphonate ABC transporter, permease protein PhnE [Trueperaceae bacterium]|nr:phosphonate ABC transporter, permease protein PhnE [Trueperaceae bacterium]
MTPGWRPAWQRHRPWWHWLILALCIAYLVFALSGIGVDPARIQRGAERSSRLLSQFLQPDFATRWHAIRNGIVESLTMTVVASVLGTILALPAALAAAANLSPRPVVLLARAALGVLRSFPEVIIAIVFVVMVGFGPFAGLLTLIVSTIAFVGKLLAEAIEEIDPRQLEAVRATGATWWQLVRTAVVPQVLPRFLGISVYRFDINFRESTILGIVGAGGIGNTLRTSIQRYDFDTSAAVLIVIIAIVLGLEYMAGWVRARVR